MEPESYIFHSEFSRLWPLDPKVNYLNHGSFGATPTKVFERYQELQQMLERGPVNFLIREMERLHEASRKKVAAFVNARPSDLVFVANATTAVNTVFRSLNFSPGDEILVTNHTYGACRRVVDFIAEQTGARVVEAFYEFPIASSSQITEAILNVVTPRTRIALIDHITSATALIHPVKEIVAALDKQGVDVMIDGAHAIGAIPLDLQETGATYYTANCHKWLCSPKSAAILHVRDDRQEGIVPLVISHAGHRADSFAERFYWQGTCDPAASLCVGEAVDYLGSLFGGNWLALMERNHQLCLHAREWICDALNIEKPCPDNMIASMATIPLPLPEKITVVDYKSADPLQDHFYRQYSTEVPFWYWMQPPRRLTRISVQLYNTPDQYRFFADILKRELG